MKKLDPRLEDQDAVVGFGDLAHNVGEAGAALWGADLEEVDGGGEADGTDGDGALAGGGVAGVEPVELEEEVLGVASKSSPRM